MTRILSILLWLVLAGVAYGQNPYPNYCFESASVASVAQFVLRGYCEDDGYDWSDGSISPYTFGGDVPYYCIVGASCFSCGYVRRGIEGVRNANCCNADPPVEPKPVGSLPFCANPIPANIGVTYSQQTGTAPVFDPATDCSSSPAGSGSNYCQVELSSSSSDGVSSSSLEQSSSSGSIPNSSSSNANQSSSGGTGDSGVNAYDCFDDPDEALIVQETFSNRCVTEHGFDGYYVNYIDELGYCIVGECKPYCYKLESEAETTKTHWDETCAESGGSPNYEVKLDEESTYYCVRGECENQSSSSQESSSSGEGGGSSASGGIFGQSCEIQDDYWDNMSGYGVFKRTLYSAKPPMKNKDQMYVSNCACNGDEAFSCRVVNFNYVHNYLPLSMPLCGFSNGYWCSGIEKDGNCDFSGSSATIYRSDIYSDEWWSANMSNDGVYPVGEPSSVFGVRHYSGDGTLKSTETYFYHSYGLPQNVSYSDLEEAILAALPAFPTLDNINAYCRGEWVPHDPDCYGSESEVALAVADSASECGYLGGVPQFSQELLDRGRGWCVVGSCELEDSSSSEYASSSSEEVSSSSFEESSSSGVEDSSSSAESSSSSASLCAEPSGYGSPSNGGYGTCINVGGKCYKCNKDRTESECESPWLWDGTQVSQEYWFSEVNCDGSEIAEPTTSGGCREIKQSDKAVYSASDCFYAEGSEGRCFAINPARVAEGNNKGWLSNNYSDSWWWNEVSCEGGGEEPEECPDNSTLNRQYFANDEETSKETVSDEIWRNKTQLFYDALGRKTQAHRETRRALYENKKQSVRDVKQNESAISNFTARSNTVPPRMDGLNLDGYGGECRAEWLAINFNNSILNPTENDFSKVGISVEFNSEFANTCNYYSYCCEYQQKVKGKVIKNGKELAEANCGTLSEYYYILDCYSRQEIDERRNFYNDSYDKNSGLYSGSDKPGLRNVKNGDKIYIEMHFQSYIQDRCNDNKIVTSIKEWGFIMDGVIPNQSVQLIGEIAK